MTDSPICHGLILGSIAGLNDVHHCVPVGAGVQAQGITFWPVLGCQVLLPILQANVVRNVVRYGLADQRHKQWRLAHCRSI